MRKIRWDVLALFAGAVLFAFVARFLTFHNLPHFSAKVEAQSPQRLQLQYHRSWGHKEAGEFTSIVVVCDTTTGNLIYTHGFRGGIAVVPNGCHKN